MHLRAVGEAAALHCGSSNLQTSPRGLGSGAQCFNSGLHVAELCSSATRFEARGRETIADTEPPLVLRQLPSDVAEVCVVQGALVGHGPLLVQLAPQLRNIETCQRT